MDADYEDYQELGRKYPNPKERYSMLRDNYGKTYWFYYEYNEDQCKVRNARFNVQARNGMAQ